MRSEMELSPQPARGAVFIEQLRSVSLAIRGEMIVFSLLLGVIWALLVWMFTREAPGGWFPFRPETLGGTAFIAFFVPLFVWRAENPERRTYLWSLPLSRRSGHLTKVASGWLWTMVAMGLILFCWWALAVVTGSQIMERSIPIEPVLIQDDSPLTIPGGWGRYTYRLPAWLILVPFGVATLLYLGGSAITLASNHPFRWGIGLYLLLLVLSLISLETPGAEGFLGRLLGSESPYGLGTMGEPVVSRPEMLPGVTQPVDVPRADLSRWVSATTLWVGLAMVAAYVAATRHREP